MVKIVEAQTIPFIFLQPLGFMVFFIASTAELNRSPFDLLEAESELIAGYHIEYSGVKFALIQAAEFGAMLATAAVIVTLFLGGWSGPASTYIGWLWFLLKMGVVAFVFIWVRATYPRVRIDQLMALAWKFLLPLSLINLFATALEVYLLRNGAGELSTNDLWIMAGINLALAGASILLFGALIRKKVKVVKWQPLSTEIAGETARAAQPSTARAGE